MLTRLVSSEFYCFSCLGYALNPALLRKKDEGEANLHILCGKLVIFFFILIYLFYALFLQRFFLDRINFFSLEIVGN